MVTIPCPCPGSPHDSDTVGLRPRLGPLDAITCRNALATLYAADPEASVAEGLGVLQIEYVLRGVETWTLVDADGAPVPVTRAAIREHLIGGDPGVLYAVADAADDLYREAVMHPLLREASSSSPPGPTDTSTSAPTDSTSTPPTPPSPSSTTTTPTDAIGTTGSPPDGASSSSPSLASVG